jgi:hypothetical protein
LQNYGFVVKLNRIKECCSALIQPYREWLAVLSKTLARGIN